MRPLLKTLFALSLLCLAPHARAQSDPVYVLHTGQGDLRVQLYPDAAPATVANFLGYVNRGDYNASFIHRSVPGFVWQGGGYRFQNGQVVTIPAQSPVVNEFGLSNVRGTLAMAKQGGDPNSATNQWFFNLGDNSVNLDNQNGGFTVFGRVLDDSSLAVMDRIAALPIIDAGGDFSSLPVVNYTSGTITGDNLVTLSSITYEGTAPAPAWHASQVAALSSGSDTRLLWNRADGAASFWTVGASGRTQYSAVFGPFAGWRARGLASASDGSTRLLWTNTDGRASVWTVASNGSINYGTAYGPITNWSVKSFAVGADGNSRLLWVRSDGAASYWTLGTSGPTYSAVFGPYTGFTAQAIAAAPNGSVRLLWNKNDGAASVWSVAPNGGITYSPTFGPFTGYTAKALSTDSSSQSRLLWTTGDGRMSVWAVSAAGSITASAAYGPFSGWTAQAFTLSADSTPRVLWVNADGRASYWSLAAGGSVTYSPVLGPF